MAFSIDRFTAQPEYCHTVLITFDRIGHKYISFAVNLPNKIHGSNRDKIRLVKSLIEEKLRLVLSKNYPS